MATFTSRLGLYKPAANGSENVNVVTDLNDNWDKLDAMVSYVPVTVGTYPASAYRGEAFYETDTGKAYINTSAVASSLDTAQILVAGADFDSSITIVGSGFYTGEVRSTSASGTNRAFVSRITGESWDRFRVDQNGDTAWGGGSAETDVYFHRSGVGTLDLGGSLNVGVDLVVSGSVTADDVSVGGNLSIGSATYRNQLSTTATVANTTTETTLATMTLPANDMVTGALYRCQVKGYASVTGTPSMTFRGRIGGTQFITSGAITASSGVLNKPWSLEFWLVCTGTGGSGTARAHGLTTETLSISGNNGPTLTSTTRSDSTTSNIAVDTTASLELIVTAQWGTANASNTLTSLVASIERVA